MSFATPRSFDPPAVPVSAQWVFQVATKTFEANTVALLQTAMNAWLLTLQTDPLEFAILNVNYQSGAKERALVTYGFYVNIINA
jgi:hypothetical protein